MVRVITQETYDEVVKENIEEFDMTPEEAIKEAIAQFEAQGVNLSNIIKDLALCSVNDHQVSSTIVKLKNYCNQMEKDDEVVLKELQILKTECEKDLAHKMRADKDGAYGVLIKLLRERQKIYLKDKCERDAVFIVSVLNALVALMDGQPDLLECNGIDFIKSSLDEIKDEDILILTLRWACVCCIKHEMNRQNLFSKDIVANLKSLLREQRNRKLLTETLQLIRKLTLDDDIRVEFGKAHDHARELGIQMLEILAELLKENSKPPIVSDIMVTIAGLLVRNELCASVATSVDDLLKVLTENYDNVGVAIQGCKLITALAGNDDVKRKIVNSGMAPVIVSIMNRHASNVNLAAISLKCVAALTLREPLHSKEFIQCDAPEAVANCMKIHPDSAQVQKNSCWAIRNMVARCREENAKFLELGVEALLNDAYAQFDKEFGFDIKSALRDLECDVKLDEQWTGKGVELEY